MPPTETAWHIRKAEDWKNYLPPARPSVSEQTVIEKYFKQTLTRFGKASLLILGCTVEYRSLAHKLGIETVLVDASHQHYEILSRQPMLYRGKEEFIECDWRELALDRKFDFVLGDHALNILDRSGRLSVLENVSRCLSEHGLFLPRSYTAQPRMPANWNQIIAKVRRESPTINFYTATAAYAYVAYTNPDTGFTDIPRLMKDLGECLPLLRDGEFSQWSERMENEKSGIIIIDDHSFDQEVTKYFTILKKARGIDPYRKYMTIHVLEQSRKSFNGNTSAVSR